MFEIDRLSRTPIYGQISDSLRHYILVGILKEGDKIPSVRELSATLSINPNTIQKAYSELDRDKIICSSPGLGCFVAEGALSRLKENNREKLSELEALLSELKLAGVDKNEISSLMNKVYGERGNEK